MESIYFVVAQEEGVWVAHGLQHNIVANGATFSEVRHNIEILIKAYAGHGGLGQIPPASAEYWEKFIVAMKSGRLLGDNIESIPVLPETYAFELQAAA